MEYETEQKINIRWVAGMCEASPENRPDLKGRGKSQDEAVGNMLSQNRHELNVRIEEQIR